MERRRGIHARRGLEEEQFRTDLSPRSDTIKSQHYPMIKDARNAM
jgi:hypothetical protein